MAKTKKYSCMKTLRYNLYMAKYVFKFTPSYVVVSLLDSIFSGYIMTWVNLYFTKEIFSFIESLMKSENPDFTPVALLFGLFIAAQLINHFQSIFLGLKYYPITANKLNEKMQMLLYEKVKTVDLACYDDPKYYNDFTWSMQQSASRATESFGYITGFIRTVLSLSAIFSVIYDLDWVAIAIVFVGVAVKFISNKKLIKINYKKALDINPVERKINYVNRVFYLVDYAKEIRLNNVTNLLFKKFDKAVDEQKHITMQNKKSNFIVNLASSLSIDIIYQILFYMIMSYRIIVTKTLSISGMMVVQQATNSLSGTINGFLSMFNSIKESSMYIQKYVDFMEYRSKVYENEKATSLDEAFNSISFKNVSFKYESSENYVIKDVSFDIHKNEKIAIVGYNGAGKSTLIKLILRLYEPDSGAVLINNKDIHDTTISSYRKKFGTVFQDFKLFSLSLAENVVMDNYDKHQKAEVTEALNNVLFSEKLKTMPLGLDTVLTREFDDEGTILSGGEMQKVAIARTFVGKKEFIIMDEPSSALDVDSEYELNKLMMSSTADKTVIFISHRLSTTRMADRIFMMENGRIIESGSHNELIKLGGKYAEMFNKQAEKYLTRG